MAGATDTTMAAAIATYMGNTADTVDSRDTPLRRLMTVEPGVGNSVDFLMNSAGNTSSTTFVEHDSPAAAGYQTLYAMTLAKSGFQYRTMYSFTGTSLDTIKNGGGYIDTIALEAKGAILDHLSYVEDATVTTIEAAIDSGGSYLGQTRANTNNASYEAAVTPTLDEMATMWSGMAADPRSVDMSTVAMLAPIEFITSYGDVATGQTAFEYNAVQGGSIDAGRVAGGSIYYNGKPFTTVGTMTDTTCLIVAPSNLRVAVWRGVQVELYAKNDDSWTYAITSVEVPYVHNAKKAGKLT